MLSVISLNAVMLSVMVPAGKACQGRTLFFTLPVGMLQRKKVFECGLWLAKIVFKKILQKFAKKTGKSICQLVFVNRKKFPGLQGQTVS